MLDLLECVFEFIVNVVFEFLFYTTEPFAGWRFYLPILAAIVGVCTIEWLASNSGARFGLELAVVLVGLVTGVVWETKGASPSARARLPNGTSRRKMQPVEPNPRHKQHRNDE